MLLYVAEVVAERVLMKELKKSVSALLARYYEKAPGKLAEAEVWYKKLLWQKDMSLDETSRYVSKVGR